MTEAPKKPRGFASMSPERLAQVSASGGKNSTSRPFRDNPGAAKAAVEKRERLRLTKAVDHEHKQDTE